MGILIGAVAAMFGGMFGGTAGNVISKRFGVGTSDDAVVDIKPLRDDIADVYNEVVDSKKEIKEEFEKSRFSSAEMQANIVKNLEATGAVDAKLLEVLKQLQIAQEAREKRAQADEDAELRAQLKRAIEQIELMAKRSAAAEETRQIMVAAILRMDEFIDQVTTSPKPVDEEGEMEDDPFKDVEEAPKTEPVKPPRSRKRNNPNK